MLSDRLGCCLWSLVSLLSSGLETGPCEEPALHLAEEHQRSSGLKTLPAIYLHQALSGPS